MIAIAGVIMGCDLDGGTKPGTGTEIPGNGKDTEEPGEGNEKTWKDMRLGRVLPVNVLHPGADSSMYKTIEAVCHEVLVMDANSHQFDMVREPDGSSKFSGLPDEFFMGVIHSFQYAALGADGAMRLEHGHPALDYMTEYLGEKVDANKRALFAACVDAYRGMNWMTSRHYESAGANARIDYDKMFDIGNGPTSVGELLQSIAVNGGTTYLKTGEYPMTQVHADAVGLLPDDVYGKLGGDVLTEMANFERLFGLIQYRKANGLEVVIDPPAKVALQSVAIHNDRLIKLSYENEVVNEKR